jgi:hypothetical protein
MAVQLRDDEFGSSEARDRGILWHQGSANDDTPLGEARPWWHHIERSIVTPREVSRWGGLGLGWGRLLRKGREVSRVRLT